MAENEKRIDPQVKNRIKAYNRQRMGAVVPIAVLTAFLFLSPMARNEILSIRLAILCCFTFSLLSVVFVLSFGQAGGLFSAAAVFMAVLLALKQIPPVLFLILTLIHTGALFLSRKTARAFIASAADEIKTINRLKLEATTDYLTQLLNRNGLEQALQTAWTFCQRHKKRVGFLMVDIDYFKSYNDTLGHSEGDMILKQVAESIQACFKRESDIIGRMGGEEFLIFLSDMDDEQIVEMAQTLSSTVGSLKIKATAKDNPFEFLSVSIGIATGTAWADDWLTDLYRQADQALYHAKRSGRNRISFHGAIIENAPGQSVGCIPTCS